MKVNLISDIHLNCEDLVLPGGDLLILAGDAFEIGHIRLAENTGRNVFLVDRYKRFLNEELKKYWKVLYVCGNHEHYHGYFDTNHATLQSLLPDNTKFLENESVEIDGVHYWGATMWTDCHGRNPLTMETVQNGMNDFRLIRYEHSHQRHGYWTNRFTIHCMLEENRQSQKSLQTFLNEHKDDTCVVITHHAPSELSVNVKYKHDYHLNGGYHGNFNHLIMDNPQIKYWVHGHMHDPVDYTIGETRILANPRGYHGYEKQAEVFDPGFIFEV